MCQNSPPPRNNPNPLLKFQIRIRIANLSFNVKVLSFRLLTKLLLLHFTFTQENIVYLYDWILASRHLTHNDFEYLFIFYLIPA